LVEIPGRSDVFEFGDPSNPNRDWRAEMKDEPDDDLPLTDEQRVSLVAQLGFDPAKA
jgi:hypothetical protein